MTGIKHYTTTTPPLGGRIKKRIEDFVVREIGEEKCETKAFKGDEKIEFPLEIPEEEKEFLILTMEKFNFDTNTAIKRITRGLHCSPKRIGYAGMKDKRAITSQKISIWKPDVEKLKEFKSRYISLRDPKWSDKKIQIGDLKANEFEITIREIDLEEKEIKEIIEKAFEEMEEGVANYFGEQRFGGIREVTHLVGKEFIKGNMEEAVMLYLTYPNDKEEESIREARKNLSETKDFAKAVKEFPSKYRYERAIIHHLCKYPRDFVGAFQNLPKHLTYMFTHAYQSYLFNEIINARIEKGIGLKAIEGDVLEEGEATAPLIGFDTEFAENEIGELEKEVLEKEGLKREDFEVKSYRELSCSGARKKITLKPIKPELISIREDKTTEGKKEAIIKFTLPKGNYATTILREIMK